MGRIGKSLEKQAIKKVCSCEQGIKNDSGEGEYL